MNSIRKHWPTAAVLGLAVAVTGAGVALSRADDPKPADLTDLRDAVAAAGKRGENVDEVAKAVDALDKALAKGLAPGSTPPELAALRAAVEAAARKGENVEPIRKELEAVELKLVGKSLARPKPAPPVDPPAPDRNFPRNDFVPPQFGGGLDPEAIQKAQDLMRKALEMRLTNPNDADAIKLLEDARKMMMEAMGGRGNLGGLDIAPFVLPDLGGRLPAENKPRLGVRMDRVGELTAEQLGIEPGRAIAITEVLPGSAAEKAGFRVHDIVLEFAGKPVPDSTDDFARLVNEAAGGKKLTAVVLRKGKKTEITGIELPDAAKPEPRPAPRRDLPNRNLLPELKPLPVPLPNALPDLPARPLEGRLQRDGTDFRGNMSVTVSGGDFTLKADQDGVSYSLEGKTEKGDPVLTAATIDDNGKVTKAASLDKVPEPYRPTVEKLLRNVGGKVRR